MFLDFVQAVRLVRRQPGFALLSIVTLGVGIGAATLVFSLVHATLLRPLPFHEPETLAWMYNARSERDRAPFSFPDLADYRQANATLADIAVFTNWSANLTGSGPPERLEGTRVAGNFFPLLGARPLLGRTLEPADEEGDARVAVLTYGLWTRRFGGDPALIGQGLSLNGSTYTVVGVMPAGFMFPFRDAEVAVPTTLRSDPRRSDRGANFLRAVARLRPGITFERAKADLDAIAHRLQRLYPDEDSRKAGVSLYPLHTEMVRDYRQLLWTLFAAVALFVTVGCANLASLTFVRSTNRASELALRMSLGATRGRIVRQLALEAGVLAAAGALLGLALAAAGLSVWRVLGPDNFPRREEVGLNGAVLAFAIGMSLLVALVCALVPARAAGRNPGTIVGATRSLTGTRRQAAVRRTFVAVQVAGAVLLLVGMGLVARGFARVAQVDAGFVSGHALSVQLSLPPAVYHDRAAVQRFSEALRLRLTAIPGVEAAGAVSLRPLTGLLSTMDVSFPGRPAPPPDEVPQAHFRIASAGYFAAAGIGVISGRAFTDDDGDETQPVAIVSRTFADRHWPGESAVGKAVRLEQGRPAPPMEVVAVVNDVKQFGLDGQATADLYVPLPQMPASQASLLAGRSYWVLRTNGDPRLFAAPLQDAVHAVDPNVATSSVQTLDDLVSSSLAGWRVNVRLIELFGEFALVLCAIGVYAVAAYSAAARRRELAIRAVFGATRAELMALLLRDELRPVVLGLVAGLCAARAAAPQLGGLLFRTSPVDPGPYLAASIALLVVALAATYIPARRAGGTNPGDLLRV